jgi:DNA-binding MarR family transcriptional regulator
MFMEPRRKPNDAWSKFALSIFALNNLLMRAGESIARPVGQSSARWQVLGRVAFSSQTVTQIAREMDHTRQAVQQLANALVKEGLIVYKGHPTDKRTKLLEITPKGLETLRVIYARQMEWSKGIMAKIDPAQLAKTTDKLESIAHVLADDVNYKGGSQ